MSVYFLICFLGTYVSIHIPVLELLQDDKSRKKTIKAKRLMKGRYIENDTSDFMYDFQENLDRVSGSLRVSIEIKEKMKIKQQRQNQTRYEFRYLLRTKAKTMLVVLLITISMVAVTGIEHAILSDKMQIDNVYKSTVVVAEFLTLDTSKPLNIDKTLLKKVTDSGLLKSSFCIASLGVKDVYRLKNETTSEANERQYAAYSRSILGFNDGVYVSYNRGYQNKVYGGYILGDVAEFIEVLEENIMSEDIPIIVPEYLLNSLGLVKGDSLYITDTYNDTHKCIVVGTNQSLEIYTHISYIEKISGEDTNYLLGDFIFDTDKNHLIKDFKIEMENYLKERIENEDTVSSVSFIVYD